MKKTKTVLNCSKDHERQAYRQDEIYYDVVDRLGTLDPAVPVHYIFGERVDLMWVLFSSFGRCV